MAQNLAAAAARGQLESPPQGTVRAKLDCADHPDRATMDRRVLEIIKQLVPEDMQSLEPDLAGYVASAFVECDDAEECYDMLGGAWWAGGRVGGCVGGAAW